MKATASLVFLYNSVSPNLDDSASFSWFCYIPYIIYHTTAQSSVLQPNTEIQTRNAKNVLSEISEYVLFELPVHWKSSGRKAFLPTSLCLWGGAERFFLKLTERIL